MIEPPVALASTVTSLAETVIAELSISAVFVRVILACLSVPVPSGVPVTSITEGDSTLELAVATTVCDGVLILMPAESIVSVVSVATVVVLEVVIVSIAVPVTVTSEFFVVRDVVPVVTLPVKLAASKVVSPLVLIDNDLLASSVFSMCETLRSWLFERSTSVKTL